jgi:hypothetical protein
MERELLVLLKGSDRRLSRSTAGARFENEHFLKAFVGGRRQPDGISSHHNAMFEYE